ncbi:30S ribosomal protein S12 methylthiotransferase RimO [candidate division LCP-89 bacterium B3_LCP]|uniref:Ribosomal protein uS12 methylthiotransferase RimO n=1 Tax=candidate division LCP-89 bacterium B3_LCP TaxID=2012998 RepID=A0A532V221_UNCL8|nr:MAG: 30S ribosomal protein S12 methylthiotransferase RimO [candidate division LCP-89 bacterium B3_LCP]
MNRLYLHNLGCAKNQIDGELLAGWARNGSLKLTTDPYEAEIIVVNTCAFIEDAKNEAIDAILDAARLKDNGNVRELYVMGCFPERYKGELPTELPEVDGFFGVGQWKDLLSRISSADLKSSDNPYLKRCLETPGHYAYLRIADGCSRGCTYCIIPHIRGRYKSRHLDEIIEEAQHLAGSGVKELLPVAQELNSYGHDMDLGTGNEPLMGLFERLCEVEGIEWIRPLYLHPPACDEKLLAFWASQPKLCRYLDLPIEHASDKILKHMGRAGTQKQIRNLVENARNLMKNCVIRTSVIVGFPGETDQDFSELMAFIEDIRFDRLGSFCYSAEEGTLAAELPDQVPLEVIQHRRDELMKLQAEISRQKNDRYVGSEREVFIDDHDDNAGLSIAHSRLELPELDGDILIKGQYPIGKKMNVQIVEATEYDLFARPV